MASLALALVLICGLAKAVPPHCPAAVSSKARAQGFSGLVATGGGGPLMSTRSDLPVLVVGAGPGGLVQTKQLLDRGIPVECAEMHSDLGGLWNATNPKSPAYDSLRMDTSRATSHFGEPGNRRDWPAYFDRDTALRFLKEYAARHHLNEKIRFNIAVTRVEKHPTGAWEVFFSDGTQGLYRAVVFASGKYNRQSAHVPAELQAQADAADLRWMHSADYRNPIQSRLAGESVLIVGASNSAIDIATDLAHSAERVWLSVRSTRWFIPEYVFGIPADEFAANGPKLPHWLEMPLFNLLQRVLVGHPRRFGFAPPDHGLLEKLPVPDRGILQAVRSGTVQLRSGIQAIASDATVTFSPSQQPSDQAVRPSVVVFATGYGRGFPFLPEQFQVDLESLPLLTFHPSERGLFFLVEPTVPEGAWPILAESAQTVAQFLESETSNPGAADRFDAIRSASPPDYKNHLFSKANDLHVDPTRFRELHSDARKFLQAP